MHMASPSSPLIMSINVLVFLVIKLVFSHHHLAMAAATQDMSTAILIRVDQSGLGDFKKIQDAIDAVPSNNSDIIFIWVKAGVYRFVCQ